MKHRCTTKDCPFLGQLTFKSCGCHIDELSMLNYQVAKYEEAIAEAEAILGGEYSLHYGPFFDLVCAARRVPDESAQSK